MTMHKIKWASELEKMLDDYLKDCVKFSREEGIDTSLVSTAFFGEFMKDMIGYMKLREAIMEGYETHMRIYGRQPM